MIDIVVCFVRNHNVSKIGTKYAELPKREFFDYTVIKMTNKSEISNTSGEKILFMADFVYSISHRTILKDRFGKISYFPFDVSRIYTPILGILNDVDFKELYRQGSRDDLLSAIYLTNTYLKFSNEIDKLEYQATEFKFGKQLSHETLFEIYEKYPEKLI